MLVPGHGMTVPDMSLVAFPDIVVIYRPSPPCFAAGGARSDLARSAFIGRSLLTTRIGRVGWKVDACRALQTGQG